MDFCYRARWGWDGWDSVPGTGTRMPGNYYSTSDASQFALFVFAIAVYDDAIHGVRQGARAPVGSYQY